MRKSSIITIIVCLAIGIVWPAFSAIQKELKGRDITWRFTDNCIYVVLGLTDTEKVRNDLDRKIGKVDCRYTNKHYSLALSCDHIVFVNTPEKIYMLDFRQFPPYFS